MSEAQYANVTVSHKMHGDRRFDLIAQLAGWSRPEACWRMVELWARCTALQTDIAPAAEVRLHLGPRGEELLLGAMLAERLPDGSLRVLGGGLSGGDTDRFGWYRHTKDGRNRKGGWARTDGARRDAKGRLLPRVQPNVQAGLDMSSLEPQAGDSVRLTTNNQAGSSVVQPNSQAGSSLAQPTLQAGSRLDQPSPACPASGFRIPDQKNLPPARAIPPSTVCSTVPSAVQSTVPSTGPGEHQEASSLWSELEHARAEAAAELGVQAQPLTFGDPGERDLAEMLAAARARGPDELRKLVAQVRHAIAMARLETTSREKPFDWFTGAVFSRNNFRRLAGKTATPTVRAGPRAATRPAGPKRFVSTDTDDELDFSAYPKST